VEEGDQWNNLSNGDHFQGAQTPELSIVDALLSFNNMQFRCLLSTQQCIQTSQEALLSVNTLGFSETESQINILQVYPSPFNQHLECKVGEAINDGQIRLSDMQGKILWQSVPNELLAGTVHNIPVEGLSEGFYVLSLYQNGKIMATQKVIKKH
jgi:hypothetical protein